MEVMAVHVEGTTINGQIQHSYNADQLCNLISRLHFDCKGTHKMNFECSLEKTIEKDCQWQALSQFILDILILQQDVCLLFSLFVLW